ncbi:tetratricopeptide repeat protein [candidate division KSB1 bacterium]|nr:tetratricopeptide repeat protein [candidate division KSB1 bacterium]RQW04244.1 MAG: tetratricopeptide repeat protein [candidate division KSB1 bacterium]
MRRVILLFMIVASGCMAEQTEYLFRQGVDAYQQNDYETAVSHFEAALQQGRASAAIYYNLGNAYYKMGQTGKAILNYERAKKLAPSDDDIEFNLQIAQLRVVDKIPSPEADFFFQFWHGTKNLLSLKAFAMLAVGLYLLLIALIVIRFFSKNTVLLNWTRIFRLPIFILLFFIGALFAVRVREDVHNRHGIILVEKVSVVSSPSADSTEMFALHEGVKIQIIAQSGDFFRIRLTDGKDGWIPHTALEII